jgi:hypothetical protein
LQNAQIPLPFFRKTKITGTATFCLCYFSVLSLIKCENMIFISEKFLIKKVAIPVILQPLMKAFLFRIGKRAKNNNQSK